MNSLLSVTIIIATYNREEVLLNTLNELLGLTHRAIEILVVDQSQNLSPKTQQSLSSMHQRNDIEWLRLAEASIPNAMNVGAEKAIGEVLLFVDDDIELTSELVLEHAKEYRTQDVHCVAGKVVQSWETSMPEGTHAYHNNQTDDPDAFQFNSSNRIQINRFIGCNVSFLRKQFIAARGFDTNFTKVAYRFESEFSERFTQQGNKILFSPAASIKHLKVLIGGTRSFGDHRKTIRPSHSVGRYYYMLVVANQKHRWWRFITSPFTSCATKFHLAHPWCIPITLVAEFSGMAWAIALRIKGPQLMRQP